MSDLTQTNMNLDDKIRSWLIKITFIVTSCIYMYTAGFGAFDEMFQRCVLITVCGIAVFLTKPFTFKGSELELNFETGAMGTLIVTVCDENGNEIEGYKTCEMFGDTVGRPAVFQKDLSTLEGKPIRLKFFLKDCDLYSFKFN